LQEEDEPSSPQHTYSKIDKSKKKRASAPPPPLPPPPPLHPDSSLGAARPSSFNIDDMYAKILKSSSGRPESNEGTRLTPRTARALWDDNHLRIQVRFFVRNIQIDL